MQPRCYRFMTASSYRRILLFEDFWQLKYERPILPAQGTVKFSIIALDQPIAVNLI